VRHATGNRRFGDRPLLAVWIFLSVLHLLPIVAADHLPMQDIPNHLAIISTLAEQDTAPLWNDRFENRLSPEPYITYYGAGVVLAKLFGAAAANRLLLALYVLLLPLSFAMLHAALGRTNRWGGLFGFLLIYTDPYLVGFTNFLLCVPMVLLAATLAVRLARRPAGGVATGLALSLLAVLVFFTHPFGLAPLAVMALIYGTAHAARRHRTVYVAAALAPSLILLAKWWLGSRGATDTIRLPLDFKLEYLLRTPVMLLENPDRGALYLATGLALALVVVSLVKARRKTSTPAGTDDQGHGHAAWRNPALLAAAVFLVAYLAAPFAAGATIWLDLRIALFFWIALFLAMGAALTRGRSGRILVITLCAVSILGVWRMHQAFDREIAPLFDLFEEMADDRRVLPILCDPHSEAIEPFYVRNGVIPFSSPYTHFGSYYHLRKGGVSPWMTFHAGLEWIPLGLKDPLYRQAFGIDGPFAPRRVLETAPRVRDRFDYLLVRGGDEAELRYLANFAALRSQAGAFALFELSH